MSKSTGNCVRGIMCYSMLHFKLLFIAECFFIFTEKATHSTRITFISDALYDWTAEFSASPGDHFGVVSDTRSTTCQIVPDGDPYLLLRGNVTSTFKNLNVTMEVENTMVVFGPNQNEFPCVRAPTILMTHQGPSNDQPCGYFCGKLNACEYNGLLGVNGTREIHAFMCSCSSDVCNELVFWFQNGSSRSGMKICEVHGYL